MSLFSYRYTPTEPPPKPTEAATGIYLAAFRDLPEPEFVRAVNNGDLERSAVFHLDAARLYAKEKSAFRREVDILNTEVTFNKEIAGEISGFRFCGVASVMTARAIYLAIETTTAIGISAYSALDRQAIREGADLELAAMALLLADKRIRTFGVLWCNEGHCRRVDLGESVIHAAAMRLPQAVDAYRARMRGERYIRVPNVLSHKLPELTRPKVETLLTSNTVEALPPTSPAMRTIAQRYRMVNALRRENARDIIRDYYPEPGEETLLATNGETDMWHMALACLEATKEPPKELVFSTWAMSKIVAEELCDKLRHEWRRVRVILIVSTLFKGRYSSQYASLINAFQNNTGRLVCANQHGKIFCCQTETQRIAFVTSANMDLNLHLETYTIYNNPNVYEFWRGILRFYEYHLAGT